MSSIIVLFLLCTNGECQSKPANTLEIDIPTIVKIESSGNPNAYNKRKGCVGLMQINPDGALKDWNDNVPILHGSFPVYKNNEIVAWCIKGMSSSIFKKEDMFDPEKNAMVGSWYINQRIPQMLKHYKIKDSIENRLIAYNWGIGNLRKYLIGDKKLPIETREYIIKYFKYKQQDEFKKRYSMKGK